MFSGFYQTIPLIFVYSKTVSWFKLGVSISLSLIIGVLVSILSVLIFIRYKERRNCIKESALAGIGTVTGFAAGVCPLCVAGLFPLILGLFGISFTFASLPFQGLEVQVLSIILLFLALFLLRK
ncbi:hypothetical protein AUJ84_01080 [Candidatus Pacearchaeota archaeon CG1_02_32_132]|nr:MAG: hypothetical protein AUJ84_01080 [Candidatus Pacearchaeota archaeon CG1_02_32_132]